jgi:hypothetical protein
MDEHGRSRLCNVTEKSVYFFFVSGW